MGIIGSFGNIGAGISWTNHVIGSVDGFYAESGDIVKQTIFDVDGKYGLNISVYDGSGNLLGSRQFMAQSCSGTE